MILYCVIICHIKMLIVQYFNMSYSDLCVYYNISEFGISVATRALKFYVDFFFISQSPRKLKSISD